MYLSTLQQRYLFENLSKDATLFVKNHLHASTFNDLENLISELNSLISKTSPDLPHDELQLYLAHLYILHNDIEKARKVLFNYKERNVKKKDRDLYYGFLKYSNLDICTIVIDCFNAKIEREIFNKIKNIDNNRIKIVESNKFITKRELLLALDNYEQAFLVGHGGENGILIKESNKNNVYLNINDLIEFDFKKLEMLGILSCDNVFAQSKELVDKFEVFFSDMINGSNQWPYFLYGYLQDFVKTGNIFSAFNNGQFALLPHASEVKNLATVNILGQDYSM